MERRENEHTAPTSGADDYDHDDDDEEEDDDFIVEPHLVCGFGEFACKDGRACIMESQRCDGFIQCIDQSDEEGCPKLGEGEQANPLILCFIYYCYFPTFNSLTQVFKSLTNACIISTILTSM